MIRTLTLPERRVALALAACLTLLGLLMGMGARQGVMAIHGAIAAALGLALVIALVGALDDPEPGPDRLTRYYDAPTRFGIVMTLNKKLSALPNSRFVLCGVNYKLTELLKLTGLDKVLTIKPTQREALRVY